MTGMCSLWLQRDIDRDIEYESSWCVWLNKCDVQTLCIHAVAKWLSWDDVRMNRNDVLTSVSIAIESCDVLGRHELKQQMINESQQEAAVMCVVVCLFDVVDDAKRCSR